MSLNASPEELVPVRILLDTGGSQTIVLASVLPFFAESECGVNVVLRGVEMGYAPRPVHWIFRKSALVTGFFPVALSLALLIEGTDVLLGNDIAGGLVSPNLEVVDNPYEQTVSSESMLPGLYPACAVTQAQARRSPGGISTV